MLRSLSTAVTFLAAFAIAGQVNAAEWQEGTHYRELSSPVRTDSSESIEVAEVFWYGCPHCYAFKPLIEEWAESRPDDVDYVQIPAALGKSWEPHAKAFYALEAMGEQGRLHDALFKALAGERRPLNSGEALAEFVSGHGVDSEQFLENYNSFGVNMRMQKAQAKIRGARITGTPTMLVNGKYTVSASMAGGHEAVLEVVDYLIEKERGSAE